MNKQLKLFIVLALVVFIFSCATQRTQTPSPKQESSQVQQPSSTAAQPSTTAQAQATSSQTQATGLKPVVFFDDVFPSYAYTYPENGLYREWIDDKKSGLASARFQWRAGKGSWCGGGIGLVRPVDLTPYRQNGKLEFWIKGEKGLEGVRKVGFQDSKGYYSMRPLRLYIRDITTDWQKVSIPMSHFSDEALMWDPSVGQEIPGTIDWTSIVQIKFDFGEGTGETNTIYVDEIKVVP
jgi:hypothetical protein